VGSARALWCPRAPVPVRALATVPRALVPSAVMMQNTPVRPWHDWYHCVANTYGTWLPGDPRGWRSCHHRERVEGDDALLARSKSLMNSAMIGSFVTAIPLECILRGKAAPGTDLSRRTAAVRRSRT
jgi:hypothetical protein